MSKVKSAIIAAIVAIAILVASFFAVVSFPYAGGSKRLNSVLSSISLGAEYTGNAEAVIYPEGVVTEAEWILDNSKGSDAKYDTYEKIGGVYVDPELKLNLSSKVVSDAKILNERLAKMFYSGYSVSVIDGYAIKVSIATSYSYADYAYPDYLNDETSSTNKLNDITTAVSALTMYGELSLRNSEGTYSYDPYDTGVNSLLNVNDDVTEYISGVSPYISGSNYAVKIDLTEEGIETFDSISTYVAGLEEESNRQIGFYVGGSQLLSLTTEDAFSESSFYITVQSEVQAKCYAAVLDAVANNKIINEEYASEFSTSITVAPITSENGALSAVITLVAILVILVAIAVVSILRYKKLGIINAVIALTYVLVMVYAAFFIGLEISVVGVIVALLGLALLMFANYTAFENVREYVKQGNVMHIAISQAYKKNLAAVLDAHIVLIIASFMVILIAKGVASTCGWIFFVASIASYALYWFTRLMWYVLSKPLKPNDQFAFGGYKREVYDDED